MPSDTITVSSPARLFDGVSARDHAVTVKLEASHLLLEPANVADLPGCPLIWLLTDTYAVAEARFDRLVVATGAAPDARLVVEDPGLRATLAPVLGRSKARSASTRTALRWSAGLLAAIVALVAAAGLATRYAAEMLPVDWGGRLSDEAIEQLALAHPICTGPSGKAALDRLTGRMAAVLDIPPPKVTTVRWDLVNAFALPGGRVVLTSGLIDRTGVPQAVAAVLAHEIGHVARRDPLAHMLREKLVDVALAAVFGVSADLGGTSAVAGFLLETSYTREQEEQADAIAIRILNELDIDAGSGAMFFDRLAEDDRGLAAFTLLRTHPLSKSRAATLRRHGTGNGPGLSAEDWHSIEAMCR